VATKSEPVLVAFGAAVRELRVERGLSQEVLADLVGIHRTYIGDVERGRRNVGLVNVTRIAAALNVAASDLISRAERLS
jgi:transcriptional regulator with XRE-family HTH domain